MRKTRTPFSSKLLNGREREILRPVFEKEFNADLPEESQANILAIIEDGSVVAFLTSEVLIRVGMLWVHPKRRGIEGAKAIGQLIRETHEAIPKGSSAVVIASEDRFNNIAEKLGMRRVEGEIWRLDL
jgi:hypothetical protein